MSSIDIESFKRLVGDDLALLRELLADFERAAFEALAAIDRYEAGKDGGRLTACAHKMKSSARSVGAQELGDAFSQLEDAAECEDWPRVARDIAALRGQWRGLKAAIDRLTSGLAR